MDNWKHGGSAISDSRHFRVRISMRDKSHLRERYRSEARRSQFDHGRERG